MAALAGDLVVAAVVLASTSPVESGLDADNPRMRAVLEDPEASRSQFESEREMMLRAEPGDLEGWLSGALPAEGGYPRSVPDAANAASVLIVK